MNKRLKNMPPWVREILIKLVSSLFPKSRLKWCLFGALLELAVNPPNSTAFLLKRLLSPTNQIITKLDQDDDMIEYDFSI